MFNVSSCFIFTFEVSYRGGFYDLFDQHFHSGFGVNEGKVLVLDHAWWHMD